MPPLFRSSTSSAPLQACGDRIRKLLDASCRSGLSLKCDLGRPVQDLSRQLLDRGRHGSAEKERLLRLRYMPQDPSDIGQKAHVEHPIGFVQHEVLKSGQTRIIVLEVVEQTPPASRR